jgi:hypothetical protein
MLKSYFLSAIISKEQQGKAAGTQIGRARRKKGCGTGRGMQAGQGLRRCF